MKMLEFIRMYARPLSAIRILSRCKVINLMSSNIIFIVAKQNHQIEQYQFVFKNNFQGRNQPSKYALYDVGIV